MGGKSQEKSLLKDGEEIRGSMSRYDYLKSLFSASFLMRVPTKKADKEGGIIISKRSASRFLVR